jgi:phenylacetate-CoA ligase
METGRGEIENRAFPPYLLEHIETMSRSALEQLQERRLLRQIAFTYERGALTRKVWDEAGLHPSQIKSLDDYRPSSTRIPFVSSATRMAIRRAGSTARIRANSSASARLRGRRATPRRFPAPRAPSAT